MRKFKIAVTGCGGMANEWVKYAVEREDAQVVALVDIKPESAKAMAERYNLSCGTFTDLEEAIRTSGANLVFDVTIPEAHKKTVTTALRMGCNVLGEKPMAASMDEAREMVSTVAQSGKSYAVMQNRRYLKNIRAFRQILSSGEIGQPGFVCADFFLGPHFGGFRDVMESPLILDMAIHTFDQARFITGADPVSVYCHEFNPAGSWYKGDASAVCIFEMSDGSVFCYRGSWCAEGCNTSWESHWRVTASKGSAIWDGHGMPYYDVVAPVEGSPFMNEMKRVETAAAWNGREGHFGCFDEMFAALMEGRKAETDCSDNIKSMAMVFAALESAKKGEKIAVKI
jgi:predicted dehydrogenase